MKVKNKTKSLYILGYILKLIINFSDLEFFDIWQIWALFFNALTIGVPQQEP
jgi:hypothetical protein